uniref:Uncharacterized protein n=1 Tax=Anguilla anguilla TaxID=7936 RepID=A0A0E9XUX5_ANGAN
MKEIETKNQWGNFLPPQFSAQQPPLFGAMPNSYPPNLTL